MKRIIDLRRTAKRDIAECYDYIVQDNPDAADRFIQKFYETAGGILAMPEMGRLRRHPKATLDFIRFLPIKDFDKYLIFYRPTSMGITIIRVVHSARDIYRMLGF